ncbi:MAG: MaoC family dehydratase [Rhodocyclaceae bacterium]|nr:MaoC family dehydratase [Rhodocyclaceae bacterium]MBX3668258.1 MaoC family dehydratase [Rhodocyclaceae bacterium]
MYAGRGYDEIAVGDNFATSMTLTETHIVLGAGLFGDFNPLHTDQAFAERSRFKGRIAHGYLTSSYMASALGLVFHGTAVAYLEHHCRFLLPVRAGDTLAVNWTITAMESKPRQDGGIVTLSGTCTNQDAQEVAQASAKMLVRNNRSAATPEA